jgi:uracil-DNA glycosylase
MTGRRRVLSRLNGAPEAEVLFVGEAPGRRGAELHGVPFYGDIAGRNFEQLLDAAALERDRVFVTNAVLCNPQTATGNNRPPASAEIAACGAWLRETIQLVDPGLVVALGAVALRALARIAPHDLRLSDAGQTIAWWNRRLAALYHPGARARAHRSLDQQLADWRRVFSADAPG